MVSLGSNLLGETGRFLCWWRDELLDLLPSFLVNDNRRKPATRLDIDRHGVTVWRRAGKGFEELATLETPIAQAQVPDAVRRRGGPALIRLTGGRALRQTVELPAAAETGLEDVLRFEMDRLTPFKSANVYHAHQVLGHDRARGIIKVAVHVAPKAVVEEAIATARELGFSAARVEVDDAGERAGGQPGLDLMPSQGAGTFARLHHGLNLALLLAVMALVGGSLWLDIERARERRALLEARGDAMRDQAQRARELEAAIEAAVVARDEAMQLKLDTPLMSVVLDRVAMRLPDHSYITELDIKDGEVSLNGYSGRVGDVVEQLSADPLIRDVRFLSQVVFDQREGAEWFHIGFKIADEAVAEAVRP